MALSRNDTVVIFHVSSIEKFQHVTFKLILLIHCIQVLTTSWSDGSPGPLGFSVPEGVMSASEIRQWNLSHKGTSWVMSSGTGSHFMSADCWMVMLEQMISPALKLQRDKQLSVISRYFFLHTLDQSMLR